MTAGEQMACLRIRPASEFRLSETDKGYYSYLQPLIVSDDAFIAYCTEVVKWSLNT